MSFQKLKQTQSLIKTPLQNFSEFHKEHSLASELPFWDFLDNCVALSDGSLVKALKLKSLSTETLEDDEVNNITLKLRSFLNGLEDGVEVSFFVDTHADYNTLIKAHQNIISNNKAINLISEDRINLLKSEMEKENILKKDIYLFVYKRPNSQAKSSILNFFKSPSQFQAVSKKVHEEELRELLNLTNSITENLEGLGVNAKSLNKKETLKLIYQFLNPERAKDSPLPLENRNHRTQEFTTEELEAMPELSHSSPTEQLLFSDIIHGHKDIFFDNYYHRILTLKTLPEYTHSGFISHLLSMPFSYSLFLHIKVPDQSKEISLIQAKRRMAHSMSVSHNGKVTDLESQSQVDSTEELLKEVISSGQKIFLTQMSLKIKDKNQEALNLKSKKALSYFRNLNSAEGLEESLGAFKVFKTCVPLANLTLARPKRMKTDNLADFLPIYANYEGGSHKPLCLFRNRDKALVNYDPFHPKLLNFNTLVTGSSGSGKSFLNNLILLQSLKENPMTFIIDIGGSYRKLCKTLGGQYVDVSPPSSEECNPVTINPFSVGGNSKEERKAKPSPRKIKFLLTLLESVLVNEEGDKLPKLEKALLEEQINILYATVNNPTLSDFKKLLKESDNDSLNQFSKMLYSWTGDTPYGQLLDKKDSFNIESDFVVFDLKGLSSYPDLQAIMILIITDFILEKIESGNEDIKKRKKRILMDECWELLKSKSSSHFMEYCVRTLRKAGSGITFITQGVEEIASHPIGSAILGNTATKFVLMQKGDLDTLQKNLKLNSQEMNLVSSLQSKKGEYSESFMVVGDDRTVIRITLQTWSIKLLIVRLV